MSNLLILPPENLRGACQGDQLKALDRTILDNWIQLRYFSFDDPVDCLDLTSSFFVPELTTGPIN